MAYNYNINNLVFTFCPLVLYKCSGNRKMFKRVSEDTTNQRQFDCTLYWSTTPVKKKNSDNTHYLWGKTNLGQTWLTALRFGLRILL